MKDLVRALSRPENLVIDVCVGTRSRAIARMLLDQHKSFVRCSINFELLTAEETDPVLVSHFQLVNLGSNNNASVNVTAGAELFRKESAETLGSKNASVQEVLSVLHATKVLQDRVLHFISIIL